MHFEVLFSSQVSSQQQCGMIVYTLNLRDFCEVLTVSTGARIPNSSLAVARGVMLLEEPQVRAEKSGVPESAIWPTSGDTKYLPVSGYSMSTINTVIFQVDDKHNS